MYIKNLSNIILINYRNERNGNNKMEKELEYEIRNEPGVTVYDLYCMLRPDDDMNYINIIHTKAKFLIVEPYFTARSIDSYAGTEAPLVFKPSKLYDRPEIIFTIGEPHDVTRTVTPNEYALNMFSSKSFFGIQSSSEIRIYDSTRGTFRNWKRMYKIKHTQDVYIELI